MMLLNPSIYLPGYAQLKISANGQPMLHKSRAARCVNTGTALNITADLGATMSLIPDSARSPSAQPNFTDPLIEQARFINEAADLDRRLALRKAMRPARSDAAKRGWAVRRG